MVVVTHGTCLKVVKASFSPPSWASVRWSTSSRRCPEMLAEKPTDFIGNKICQKRNAPCHPKAIFEVPWPALCQLVVMNRHEERSAASIIFFTGKHCSGGQSCYNFFCNFFVGHFGSCPLRKKRNQKKIRCFRFTAAYSEFASVAHQPDILIALRVWVVHIICSKRGKIYRVKATRHRVVAEGGTKCQGPGRMQSRKCIMDYRNSSMEKKRGHFLKV